MSSIYGPRQHGCEDHGWIAHFLKRSLTGEPVAIHGTGKQVRDVLFVDDLVEALLLARKHSAHVSGGAFNIGGGVGNTLSVLELVDVIEELTGERPQVIFVPERTDDARYYVADTRRFRAATGWSAQVDVRQGLRELYLWLSIPYERHRRARVHLTHALLRLGHGGSWALAALERAREFGLVSERWGRDAIESRRHPHPSPFFGGPLQGAGKPDETAITPRPIRGERRIARAGCSNARRACG